MLRLLRIGFIFSLMIWSGRAWAGEQPPPDDPYGNVRDDVRLDAWNNVKGPDGRWMTIDTDLTGQFNVELWLYPEGRTIDAYFKHDSADDPSRLLFDVVEYLDNGDINHFQGFSSYAQYTWGNGNTTTYWNTRVNGGYHAIEVETDPDGNVVNSQTVNDSHARDRRDPCDVIADWGALQCPKNLTMGPKQIPAKVLSLLRSAGWGSWISDAYHGVAHEIEKSAHVIAGVLRDPIVQGTLVGVAAVLTVVACCYGTVGVACYFCAAGAIAADAAATGGIISSSTPADSERSSNLRSDGLLGCEKPDLCAVDTTDICVGCL